MLIEFSAKVSKIYEYANVFMEKKKKIKISNYKLPIYYQQLLSE